MLKNEKESYDAVIIGAGISGLVCGCYLAKAGMKVLIAEQHFKAGGYCTSFKRRGFAFDAAAHSFGSYREGGIMNNILKELNLNQQLKIKRYEPSDVIIAPDHRIVFWSEPNRTARELQKAFPHEAKGISDFFHFLLTSRPFDFAALKNITYDKLLNRYFRDEKLKSILSVPILGLGGLPADSISAFSACVLFIEFFIDGGYYPEGGMQALPDALAERFKALGGELWLRCPVEKIKLKTNRVEGVVLEKTPLRSKFVVSCCDARQTFFRFLDKKILDENFIRRLKNLTPSPSFFIAYLGLDKKLGKPFLPGVSFWIMPHYKVNVGELSLNYKNKLNVGNSTGFVLHIQPDEKSMIAYAFAPFKNRTFWADNKDLYLQKFIKRIETVFPELSTHIVAKYGASPHTLHRYTLNYKGAPYGWATFPSQLLIDGLAQATPIENLFLSGHWTTQAQGISGVAYIGRETAKLILKKLKQA